MEVDGIDSSIFRLKAEATDAFFTGSEGESRTKEEEAPMRKLCVVVCCVLLSTSLLAQSKESKGTKADPITGTWTGELTPVDSPRSRAITMDLKFDGKTTVTGTMAGMPNPADVKRGTFDAKTGTLKLELGKTGEPAVLLTLDGTVAKGTASGKLSGEVGGTFKLTKKP